MLLLTVATEFKNMYKLHTVLYRQNTMIIFHPGPWASLYLHFCLSADKHTVCDSNLGTDRQVRGGSHHIPDRGLNDATSQMQPRSG
jgi:hypothetical protein